MYIDDDGLCRSAAIDGAARWGYVEIPPSRSALDARGFLGGLLRAAGFMVTRVLTDNGEAFNGRFAIFEECQPTAQHAFDEACVSLAVEHRPVNSAQLRTNGKVERSNGRIGEMLPTQRICFGPHVQEALSRDARLYGRLSTRRVLSDQSSTEDLRSC